MPPGRRTRRDRPRNPPPARVSLGTAAAACALAAVLAGVAWGVGALRGVTADAPPVVAAKGSFVSLSLALGATVVALQVAERPIRATLAAIPALALLVTLPFLAATWRYAGAGFHPWWILVPATAAHAAALAALVGAARRGAA